MFLPLDIIIICFGFFSLHFRVVLVHGTPWDLMIQCWEAERARSIWCQGLMHITHVQWPLILTLRLEHSYCLHSEVFSAKACSYLKII